MTYFRPFGFDPREETEETDYPVTPGLKGECRRRGPGTSASTYGKDDIDLFTRDSANASLFAATGQTPVNFYDGTYTSTQWTTNIDITQDFEVGHGRSVDLAFGAEYREETWEAAPGDEASRYFEGGQSFPGISLSDAGQHDRDVVAGYVDVPAAAASRALRLTSPAATRTTATSATPRSASSARVTSFSDAVRAARHGQHRLPRADPGRGVLLGHQCGPDHGLRADAAQCAGHGAAGSGRGPAAREVDQLLGGLRVRAREARWR